MTDPAPAACQPPDPGTRAPLRATPKGAVDCHAHVFGPGDRFPFAASRSYTPPEAPLHAFRSLLDRLGIDRAVIVQPSVYGTDNRCMLDAMAALGRECRGVAVVDSAAGPDELRALRDRGIGGLRVNYLSHNLGSLRQLEALDRRIAGLDWHMQVVQPPSALEALAPVLAGLRATVVVDHMGLVPASAGPSPELDALLRVLGDGRTWVKLSGAYRVSEAWPTYRDAIPLMQTLYRAAPDRCVWGSDWPHTLVEGAMPNDGDLLDLLWAALPDEAAVKRVLVDNPARLYGFPQAAGGPP